MTLAKKAKKETLKVVSKSLSLDSPSIVGCPQNRDNISHFLEALPPLDYFFNNVIRNEATRAAISRNSDFLPTLRGCFSPIFFIAKMTERVHHLPPSFPVVNQFVLVNITITQHSLIIFHLL